MEELTSELQKEISKYHEVVQQAYRVLNDTNRSSLLYALAHCGIRPDTPAERIMDNREWETFTSNGRYLYFIASKGNLFMAQEAWSQSTGSIASDGVVFKDTEGKSHVMFTFKQKVPHAVLRMLYLNAKKQTPVLTTLYGYEPYNLQDMSKEEFQKQKALADATAATYLERYKDHIELLINKSPYQAANAFLNLQANINLEIQQCIHELLQRGHKLTIDSLVHYSFEPIANATRELLTKYHAEGTTEEDKHKIKRYLALYFETIESTKVKAAKYIESLRKAHTSEEEEAALGI